jgi:hypothetical protein
VQAVKLIYMYYTVSECERDVNVFVVLILFVYIVHLLFDLLCSWIKLTLLIQDSCIDGILRIIFKTQQDAITEG